MSIDSNNQIDAALVGINEQIDESHKHMPQVWDADGVYGDRITFSEANDKDELEPASSECETEAGGEEIGDD